MNLLGGHKRRPGQPIIVAFSGAPGSGRSTMVAHLGRYFLRKGKRVLAVDADIFQPRLHIYLGLSLYDDESEENFLSIDKSSLMDRIIEGATSNQLPLLSLTTIAHELFKGTTFRGGSLVARLRALSFDYIFIDLPSAPGPAFSSVLVHADVPIFMTSIETGALAATTHQLRWALIYGMLNHPDAPRMGEQLVDRIGRIKSTDNIERILDIFTGSPAAVILDSVIQNFSTYLVLNKIRESSERELGQVIALAWYRSLGLRPRVLYAIDFDDRRWFHERLGAFMTAIGSSSGAGIHTEELAKQLLALGALDLAQPRVPYGVKMNAIELFGLSKRANPLDIRQSYRQLWEGMRRESSVTRTMFTRMERAQLLEELETANRELQTWLAERTEHVVKPKKHVGYSPGTKLKEARQDLELSLRELSLRTKIGLRYIEAIEAFEIEHLPRPAYLRGYLREIARMLKLDPQPLLDHYLSTLAEAKTKKKLRY